MGIKKGDWCTGGGAIIESDIDVEDGQRSHKKGNKRDVGMKRKMIRCPVCNRRLTLSLSYDQDSNAHAVLSIPKHKVRGRKKKTGRVKRR